MTNTSISPPASMRLRGHDPVPAHVVLEPRSRQTRLVKGLLTLLGFLVLIPIVALVPPHIPWVLIAFGTGVYFTYRQVTGEYVVHEFQGECPRCHAKLEIKPGEKVRIPLQMDCYQCHHKPQLELVPV